MKTVALLLMARTALAWICVLGGSTPFASLVMIDLGKLRSYKPCQPRVTTHHSYDNATSEEPWHSRHEPQW